MQENKLFTRHINNENMVYYKTNKPIPNLVTG